MADELTDAQVFGDTQQAPPPPPQGGGEMSDDEVFGASANPNALPKPPPTEGDELSDDDVFGSDQSSAAGAFLRQGARAAPVGAVGAAAAIPAAAAAAELSLPVAPFFGAAAPAVPIVAGLIGGGAAAMGAGALASMGEDKLLALLGLDKSGPLSNTQRQQDIAQQPTASFAGELAGSVLPGFGAGGAGVGARALGAAVQGGMEAGQELYHGDKLDPTKIGLSGAAGAVFARPRDWTEGLVPSGYRAGNKSPIQGGQNPNPDIVPTKEPAPDIGELSRANDLTTTAQGVSADNPPAPEIQGAGNPVGAPMVARTGAKPRDPGRNYGKASSTPLADTGDSVVFKETPVAPDMAQALTGATEQVQQPGEEPQVQAGGTPQPGPQPEAAPTPPPNHDALLEQRDALDHQLNNEPNLARRGAIQQQLQTIETQLQQPKAAEPVVSAPEDVAPPEQRAAAPEPAAPPVATGLTPDEIRVSTQARAQLKAKGLDLQQIDKLLAARNLSPREKAQAYIHAANMTQSASGEGMGRTTGELRAETPRQTLETGAVAASKGDAARKTSAIKRVTDIYNELGPASEGGRALNATDPDASKAYVKQVWDEALKRNNGVDPLVRTKNQYVPLKQGEAHTQAYQWLRAVKQAATRRNLKPFTTLHLAPETAGLTREGGRIEGDIAHRPQLPEASEDAMTAADAKSRPTFEPIPRLPEGKDNSYVDSQNELREWVNDLQPRDYEALAEHFDVPEELDEPADPHALLTDMMDTLQKAGSRQIVSGKRPGTVTDQVESAPKNVEPESSPGRVLDRNSPEFKEIAAKYGDVLPPEKPDPANPMDVREAAASGTSAADGNWKSFAKKYGLLLSMQGKTKGAPAPKANPLSWLRRQPKSPMSPDADAATKEVVRSLGSEMSRYSKGAQDIRSAVRAVTQVSPDFATAEAAQTANRDAYRWIEDHPDADDAQIKDDKVFNIVRSVRRLQAEKARVFSEMRTVDPNNELELPPPASMTAQTEKNHVARLRVMDQTEDVHDVNPFHTTNRSLSSWRGSLQQRDYKVLSDGKGMRIVFTHDPSGKVRLWWQGRPVDRGIPAGFEGNVGDKLNVPVNKKNVTMTVDHATVREIMKHARGEDGEPLTYHESPLLTEANSLVQAQDALDTFKLVQSINTNKGLLDNSMVVDSTATHDAAMKKDYVQTKLQQFKTRGGKPLYMDRRIAEVLDDFRQPGFDEDSLQSIRSLGTNLIKTLFVMNPLIHGFNVGASWGVQRGWDWVTPQGNKRLAATTFDAIKAVLTQDQKILKPAMRNNLTLLLPGTLNQRLMQGIARKAGTQLMAKPPAWWDAMIAPHWNMRASDVGAAMLKYANTITWGMSDVMTLQRYLENTRYHNMSPQAASAETHEFLPDYQVPTRVNEKMFGQSGGRFASKLLRERGLSIFGPYHYDLWKQLAQMTSGVAKGNPKAAGQLMAMAVGMYLVYPYLLDRGAQKATGNKFASVGRRGPLAIGQAASDTIGLTSLVNSVIGMITGSKPQRPVNSPRFATDIYSPAIPEQLADELLNNKDFTGHPIWQGPQDPTSLRQWGQAGAHVVDWALSTALPPYQVLTSEMRKQGVKQNLPARLAQEQVGIKDPTPASIKFQQRAPTQWKREEKYRMRHSGPVEGVINRVTR